MKTWNRGGWAVIVALGIVAAHARAAGLADAIPANAKAAVILGNAKELEKNIRAFAQAIGTPLPEGIGLELGAQMAGIGDVWQQDRGAALVVVEAAADGMAIVLPVADAKAALKKLNATADGAIYKLNLFGTPATALPKDGTIVVAPSAKSLEAFKSATKTLASQMQAVDRKVAADAGLFVYVNIPELKDLALSGLDFFDQMIKPKLAQAAKLGNSDPAVITRMFDMYGKALRALVNDGRSFCLALSVTADRVQIQKGLTAKPGTTLAKYFAKEDSATAVSLIEDLPSRPFVAAMGWDADLSGDLWRDATMSMLEAAGSKLDQTERDRIAKYMDRMFGAMESMNMLMDMTDDGMTSIGHYESKKPEEYLRTLKDGKNEAAALSKAFMPGAKLDVSMSSKKVGKLDVTEFVYTFSGLPADQMKMLKAMYGGEGMRMQMAVVDKEMLGYASAPKGDPIALLEGKEKLVAEKRIKSALSDLPEKAGLVVLIDPTSAIRFIKVMMEKVGPGIPLPLPNYDKPIVPIALAGMGEKDGVVFRVVVRADTVRDLVKPVLGR